VITNRQGVVSDLPATTFVRLTLISGLVRDQYNPELTLPDSVVNDLLAVGTFRSKEQEKATLNLQSVRDWTFAEKAKR
jgi:hypothetical protein